MIKRFKNHKGFTLVELLVVITVLITVGIVSVQIITSSLRGTNKTNLIDTVRQNGNYAISQMAKAIQYSEEFLGLSPDDSAGSYTRTCPSSPADPPVPVTTSYKYIKIKPFDEEIIKYGCGIAGDEITSNTSPLINTSSVAVSDCSISCTQAGVADPPIITVFFKLSPKNPGTLFEQILSPITFQTSVTMRNYKIH